MLCITKKIQLVFYLPARFLLYQVSRRKGLKCRYFALINLKTDSPFNFTLKDMNSM